MVYQDDDTIMIGGVLLPGLYKKVEVKTAAKIDEQEVEGSSAKPKQATGYEDAQISIELELHDSETQTKEDKLAVIQNLFRMRGQELPEVYPIISTYTAIRNVDQVLIKDMSSQSSNKKDMLTVNLELMEYIPQTIKAKKKKSNSTASGSGGSAGKGTSSQAVLNQDYSSYLQKKRGSAPKKPSKTAPSPAVDDDK